MVNNEKKVVVVQRELMGYRYDLLEQLGGSFNSIKIVCAKNSTNKSSQDNIVISVKRGVKLKVTGDTRSTYIYFMPSVLFDVISSDIILIEGTTNILTNILCVPFARILNKKIIWWDAGYSPTSRTLRRKVIDRVASLLISITHAQIAYSTKAKTYMERYMGARNCEVLINTISTSYFESIVEQVENNNTKKKQQKTKSQVIKLLFVGVVEKRKKIKELIDIVGLLQIQGKKIQLRVVGGGVYLDYLKSYVSDNGFDNVHFLGPIYDREELKELYFDSDLFVMPGDGGLAVLQSMLYGLPCICCSADGTEEDYFEEEKQLRVFQGLDALENLLRNEKIYCRVEIKGFLNRVNSDDWIKCFVNSCNKIVSE